MPIRYASRLGLVPGVVIAFPGPVHRQRLHAHEPVTGRVRQAHQRLPAGARPTRTLPSGRRNPPRQPSPAAHPGSSPSWPACGVAVPVVTDLADDGSLANLLFRVRAELGPVDELVNNAGFAVWKRLEATTMAE